MGDKVALSAADLVKILRQAEQGHVHELEEAPEPKEQPAILRDERFGDESRSRRSSTIEKAEASLDDDNMEMLKRLL